MRLTYFIPLFACGLFVFDTTAALARRLAGTHSPAQKQNAIIVVRPQQKATTVDQKVVTLADFSWLAGRWEGKLGAPSSTQPLTAEQEWMPPKNGTMQGFFRLTDNAKTIVIELFTIRETSSGIEFYFRHFSPELKPWEEKEAYHLNLTKSEGGAFRFDNPVVNELKDAILTRVDNETYISRGDITDADGKPKAIEVTYHRLNQNYSQTCCRALFSVLLCPDRAGHGQFSVSLVQAFDVLASDVRTSRRGTQPNFSHRRA